MKKINEKKEVATGIISLVIFSAIFIFTRLYINENNLLCEAIDKMEIFVFIGAIITQYIIAYNFVDIKKSSVIYISCIFSFLVSLYVYNLKINIGSIFIRILFVGIFVLLIKFAYKKMESLDKKLGIILVAIIYIVLYSFQIEILSAIASLFIMNKFYFLLKSDNFVMYENYEVILAIILFTAIFDLEFMLYFYFAYNFNINSKNMLNNYIE